jgi:starch synthase
LGIWFADKINTVSETYAKELLSPEFSGGLEGVLLQRSEDLSGIINGVDYSVWSPEKDKLIPVNYSPATLDKKEENKKALAAEFGLKYEKETPILAVISRLVSQKGFDLFLDLFDYFVDMNADLVVLGSGEEKYERFFNKLQFYSEGNVKVHLGYNNNLAHLIEAGADIFLMPSLYEPCGLNQIYSLKYGTAPLVRETGGLADTVQDWDKTPGEKGNGFSFAKFDSEEFRKTIERALRYFNNKKIWHKIQLNGMKKDYSWKNSAKKYQALYGELVNG